MNSSCSQSDVVSPMGLGLARLGSQREAGLLICSLPLPRRAPDGLSVGGRATYRQPIGQWSGVQERSPRRLLMLADGTGGAPEWLTVSASDERAAGATPTAEAVLFARSPEPEFIWDSHELRITWNNVSVSLRMGLRTAGEVHWWEACRLVTVADTPFCRVVEMGGAIPVRLMTAKDMYEHPGYTNPFLHNHNWLNGDILARLCANGVCEIYAHHTNSRFFDDGKDFEDVVPVIGIRVEAGRDELERLCGPYDGTTKTLELGNVCFDLTEGARFATPEQPGSMTNEDGVLVWQPYQGMELYGGVCPKERTGDPFILHAEEKRILRGMAKTVRFSFSLSPQCPPNIVRYQAPAWWYGVCEEFQPAPLLPVSNEYDRTLEACRRYANDFMVNGGFEDGLLPRGVEDRAAKRHEPSWEGEVGYGLFLHAWRTGDATLHEQAMRASYQFTDQCIDHATKLVRMHGYGGNAFALPMQRVHTTVAAYLENGDGYLLDAARAVIDNAYWLHKNSWPRMAVGRDACFIRGAVLLYRYFADEHYLAMACDAAKHVAQSQRPEGSFGDQGGGTGIHQWAAYITKPWMGLMAVGGLLDLLEMGHEDPDILACVKKFADWLMRERYDHAGVMGWGYQHDFDGGRRFMSYRTRQWHRLPGAGLWHVDYLARLMMYCSVRFRTSSYFDAWAESYAVNAEKRHGDHGAAQSLQYIPRVQAWLWNARLEQGRVRVDPLWLSSRTPTRGVVKTPFGDVELMLDKHLRCHKVRGDADVCIGEAVRLGP